MPFYVDIIHLSQNTRPFFLLKQRLNDNGSEYLNHRLFMFVKRRQRTTKAGLNLLVLNDHDMQSCRSTVENDGRHHHWLNLARIRILANMLTCQPFTSDGYNGIQNM